MSLNDFKYMIKEAVTRYLEFNAPCLEVRVLLGLLLVVHLQKLAPNAFIHTVQMPQSGITALKSLKQLLIWVIRLSSD